MQKKSKVTDSDSLTLSTSTVPLIKFLNFHLISFVLYCMDASCLNMLLLVYVHNLIFLFFFLFLDANNMWIDFVAFAVNPFWPFYS